MLGLLLLAMEDRSNAGERLRVPCEVLKTRGGRMYQPFIGRKLGGHICRPAIRFGCYALEN